MSPRCHQNQTLIVITVAPMQLTTNTHQPRETTASLLAPLFQLWKSNIVVEKIADTKVAGRKTNVRYDSIFMDRASF